MLEATDATGAAQPDYVYLDGRPVATLNPSTGALYFLHDDMLGTPQLATDSGQNIQWQASYDAFGQASVSGTVTQNLRFPGQYFDLESGWNHNGFRNYLPDLGRYAEPDPLGMQGSARNYSLNTDRFLLEAPLGFAGSGPNLYEYAGDNPIDFTDPLGLYSGPYGPQLGLFPMPWGCVFSFSCSTTTAIMVVQVGPEDNGSPGKSLAIHGLPNQILLPALRFPSMLKTPAIWTMTDVMPEPDIQRTVSVVQISNQMTTDPAMVRSCSV